MIQRFVHDYETRKWLEASGATFVYAEAVHTPMGSGLAAFIDVAAARKRAEEWKGQVMNLDQAKAFRTEYMRSRYGGEK